MDVSLNSEFRSKLCYVLLRFMNSRLINHSTCATVVGGLLWSLSGGLTVAGGAVPTVGSGPCHSSPGVPVRVGDPSFHRSGLDWERKVRSPWTLSRPQTSGTVRSRNLP